MVKNLRLLFVALLCAVFNVSMAQTYQTVSLPYEVNFTQGQGAFVIEDVENELGTDIWTQGSQYGMTATTYVQLAGETKKTNHDGESWLVSPIIDLSNASTASLALTDQVNKFFGNIEEEISVNVREAGANTWTNLNVAYEKPSSTWGGWKDQVVDLSSYAGKKVQIGFHYIGKAATARRRNDHTHNSQDILACETHQVIRSCQGIEDHDRHVGNKEAEAPYAYCRERHAHPVAGRLMLYLPRTLTQLDRRTQRTVAITACSWEDISRDGTPWSWSWS